MTASLIYDSFCDDLANGNITPSSDTFYVMLVNGYTPAKTTDTKRSDVGSEATGTGYSSGGASSAITITKNTGANTETLNWADVVWTITGNMSATGAVIYKHRGGASSADNLVAYVDFGGTASCSNSTFTFHLTSPLTFQN